MGLQVVPGFIGQVGYAHPAEMMRNQMAAHAGRRTGAFRYNDFAATPSAVAMQMAIGAGDGFLQGTEQNTQGGYYAWSNASENIAWPAAAGSPRVDSLILRVIDTQYGSDAATPQALWQVVSGTPAGSPVKVPDVSFASGGPFYRPGAWWRVLDVQVPAGATNLAAGTLTHYRKYARIGRHTMALSTDYPTDAQIGDSVTSLGPTDTGQKFHYDGTSWVLESTPGWVDYSPLVYTNMSTTPASISRSITYARYRKMGKTVDVVFSLTANATTTGGCGVQMPFECAPLRLLNVGTFLVMGSSAPSPQAAVAAFLDTPNRDKITSTTYTSAFQDVTLSGQSLRGSVRYECV